MQISEDPAPVGDCPHCGRRLRAKNDIDVYSGRKYIYTWCSFFPGCFYDSWNFL